MGQRRRFPTWATCLCVGLFAWGCATSESDPETRYQTWRAVTTDAEAAKAAVREAVREQGLLIVEEEEDPVGWELLSNHRIVVGNAREELRRGEQVRMRVEGAGSALRIEVVAGTYVQELDEDDWDYEGPALELRDALRGAYYEALGVEDPSDEED